MDIYYLVLVMPALVIAIWAQYRVKSTFSKYQNMYAASRLTGYTAARMLLDSNGLQSIPIERATGYLADHYDPKRKVIRLSESVYDSRSVAAIGVAAHEAGHALQYAGGYFPIRIRSSLLPITNIGSTLSMPLIILGYMSGIIELTFLGIGLFSLVTIFQLITLPVEFNASRRAIVSLETFGMLTPNELNCSRKVLNAAALTYVASLLVSFMSLIRLLLTTNKRTRR
ncbi:MAG: zinc metallopeptidase [Oscillospiraceae bacterium]|nr:zinc metallopeptidase [Oscillospiraceae bacterium]